jgi:hypothetical protein
MSKIRNKIIWFIDYGSNQIWVFHTVNRATGLERESRTNPMVIIEKLEKWVSDFHAVPLELA